VELVPITTDGDVLTGPLAQLGGTGVFVAALRDALLRGECDLVVHSMKDLPTGDVAGLQIGAVPPRASVRDVLCGRDGLALADLPHGAVVGRAPRRVAQLLRATRSRGPRHPRQRRHAAAQGRRRRVRRHRARRGGLSRIGRTDRITDTFDATGGRHRRSGRARRRGAHGDAVAPLVARLSDADAEATALLERAVLRRLEAGCAAPVGITAVVSGDDVSLVAEVYALDGTRAVRVERTFARAAVAGSDGRRMPRRPLCGSFSMPGPVTSPTSREWTMTASAPSKRVHPRGDCAERACSCRAAVRGARVATAITRAAATRSSRR
jgi:hydroxymethylbilane synthase